MSQRVEFAIQPMLDENAVKGASLLFLLTLFVIEYFISCLSSDNQSINQSILRGLTVKHGFALSLDTGPYGR